MVRPIRISPYMKVRIYQSRGKVEMIRYSRGNKQIKSSFDISFEELHSIVDLIEKQTENDF
jgi:hypothetical protein